jgi:hypothetical protein
MIEKNLFLGGLNSDDEDRLLAAGDYRYALNIRNSKTDKASVGSIENTKGNTEITFALPDGINKCIGSKYDSTNNRIIFFISNNLSSHSIYELNIGTQVVTLLLQSSVFNFNRDYPILHCEIIDDLCYWTDEFNPERKINIARAKSGGYITIDEQAISRIQYAPNYSPIAQYGSDGNTTFNKVRGKMFQFRYAYVYEDNETSSFSPVSKIAIPTKQSLYDFGGYYETTDDNFIAVEFDSGNYLCKRIQLVVRESNTADWALVKEFDKSELGISNNNVYTYNFYNNEVFIPITQASVNKLFDNVPLKSGAISLIDGNRLVSSDITEGYDNINLLASATPFYNETPPPVTSLVKASSFPWGTNLVLNSSYNFAYFGTPNVHTLGPITQFIFIDANTVNDTDLWNFSCSFEIGNALISPYPIITSFKDSFVEQFPAGETSYNIADRFINLINTSTKLNGTVSYNGLDYKENIISGYPTYTKAYLRTEASVFAIFSSYIQISITYYGFAFSTSTSENSACQAKTSVNIDSNIVTKTFKKNAKHSFALVYYDNPNRSGVCQVSDSFDVEVSPYFNLLKKGSVEMDINIENIPPSWAKYYQILYTGNRSVSTYLQIDTGSVSILGSQLKIYINTIAGYNTLSGNKATLSYSWAKGDRVTFIGYGANLYFNEFYDLEIISSTSDTGGQYIIVDNVLPVSLTNGTLIELYTPKLNQEQVFYWEIGEVYPIENGFHAGDISQVQTASVPAIIRVNSGDSYFRYRGYNTDSFIEDYSLSDFYTSNSWDKGRFNVVDKEYKQMRRYATSYYSESFVPDTNINGLSTVYDTSFHEANKSYGAIQKTYAEQDRIYFFQQLRTGFSLVNKDVLYSSDGTPNGVVGQASQILSDVNYYIQDYGIGDNPESFAVEGTRKYHVDANKGFVLRLSIDGYTPISDYKYRNYFQDLFNKRKSIDQAYLGRIWGAFDRRFDEYILAFEKCKTKNTLIFNREGAEVDFGDILIEADIVSFSEDKKRWVTHYSGEPEFIQLNGIDLVTWRGGKMYLHNSNNIYNNFYGKQFNSNVKMVSNEAPSNIKVFSNIYQESSDAWSCILTNKYGQESSLEVTDFELNEGVYYAALLKDINTPNVALPLIEGDDMRCYEMTIDMTNSNTSFVRLFAINVGFKFSEFTNK